MIFKILQIAVPFVWFGLVGGISFLEAPLKFQAPNITIPLGLGIGRLVFFWLNKIEIALMILMLVSLVFVRPALFNDSIRSLLIIPTSGFIKKSFRITESYKQNVN